MHARTQIYPLLTSSIQYKAPLCSCSPISSGEVFYNVFLMNSCISSVRTIFNKRWNDSVLQVSPISLDHTMGPHKQRQCTPLVQFKWKFIHWFETLFTWEVVDLQQAWLPPDPGAASTEAWSADRGRRGETWEYPKCQIRWLFIRWLFDFIAWKSKI